MLLLRLTWKHVSRDASGAEVIQGSVRHQIITRVSWTKPSCTPTRDDSIHSVTTQWSACPSSQLTHPGVPNNGGAGYTTANQSVPDHTSTPDRPLHLACDRCHRYDATRTHPNMCRPLWRNPPILSGSSGQGPQHAANNLTRWSHSK